MQNLVQNKVLIGIVLTFLIGGLGAISGLLSPTWSGILTMAISILTAVGHSNNLIKGAR